MSCISAIARKLLMAATGQLMILFVLVHLAGLSSMYTGAINAYAAGLRTMPFVMILWCSRILLFLSLSLHLYNGILRTIENRRAKPDRYVVSRFRRSTLAGRSMIWSGVIIALFLLAHLARFTFHADFALDALGRPDVRREVLEAFRRTPVATLHLAGLLALAMHLSHGIQSSLQTWGLIPEGALPAVEQTGTALSLLLSIGFAAAPILIMLGSWPLR